LAGTDRPWAHLLVAHLNRWFWRWYPTTRQHDALTLAVALGLSFVCCTDMSVRLDEVGRMSAAADGALVRLSISARYPEFMAWLTGALDTSQPPAADGSQSVR
jgi:pyrimidine-specific ribonucleoside hydrolase